MLGAIIGDIIGSPYEWHNIKTKDFELFRHRCRFTDDSVMTIAVAEALMEAKRQEVLDDEAKVKKLLVASMKKWGLKYPEAGYGRAFFNWLISEDSEPYNSWGNGSAMRVSPAGWMADNIINTRKLARWTAEVTHNHPEGVKGAEAKAPSKRKSTTISPRSSATIWTEPVPESDRSMISMFPVRAVSRRRSSHSWRAQISRTSSETPYRWAGTATQLQPWQDPSQRHSM